LIVSDVPFVVQFNIPSLALTCPNKNVLGFGVSAVTQPPLSSHATARMDGPSVDVQQPELD
jgi:hypothetical protein